MERKNFGQRVLVPIGYSGIRPDCSDIIVRSRRIFLISLQEFKALVYKFNISFSLSRIPTIGHWNSGWLVQSN